MKKMFNKAVLNGTTVMGDGLTYPRIPNVYTGDNEGGYQRGDMMDANAVVEMIKELTDTGKITIDELKNLINEEIQERVEGDQDQQRYTDQKIKDLIGTSPETLDTLKEIADALGEDPDFAANVWEKLSEVDKTLEDYKRASSLPKYVVGEGMDPGTSPIIFELTSNGINLNVYRTDLDTGDTLPKSITNAIPEATQNMPGIMSASDKIKMNRIPDELMTSVSAVLDDPSNIKIRYYGKELYTGASWHIDSKIKPATSSLAGAMSAADKQKLDGIEAGAQVNTIESITFRNTPVELIDKTLELDTYITGTNETNFSLSYKTSETDNSGQSIYKQLYGLSTNRKYIEFNDSNEDSSMLIDLTDTTKQAIDNAIQSVSVNGTPLEITNKGVNIPIHEYTAGDGIKLENGKFSLDTIEHTERSYTTELIGPKEEPALNIPIVDESGKLNKNILIPNVADLSNRTPTEWTGEIDDLGCIRYEDYKNISDYYYNFTKNIFFYPIQDNQLLMYNIGKGIDDDKLSDFLKNPNNYDNWNIPVAIYLSDGLLASGGLYGEVPVYDPNDDSKVYYPGGVFGFKVNIDKSENNLLTFTEGEDYTDGFSPSIVNTKKLIVPKQSVIDTIVNSNEFKAKQDALTEVQLNNINNAITSISINNIEQVNTNGAVDLTIPNASITENGLMSKEDKTKLDSQPTIKANNATGVTDDDYVVIKKSEYQSILDRLSALENKA